MTPVLIIGSLYWFSDFSFYGILAGLGLLDTNLREKIHRK